MKLIFTIEEYSSRGKRRKLRNYNVVNHKTLKEAFNVDKQSSLEVSAINSSEPSRLNQSSPFLLHLNINRNMKYSVVIVSCFLAAANAIVNLNTDQVRVI